MNVKSTHILGAPSGHDPNRWSEIPNAATA